MVRNHRLLRQLTLALVLACFAAPSLAADGSALTGVVNVNTATVDQLQILPGVGEVRARAILDERKQRGGFKQVEDLVEVRGIGETLLEQLRPFVAVQGKTTARIQ